MPELPEVERARRLIAETCTGCVIDAVDTVEDALVYDGADHTEFARELRGRTVTGCERKGKQFWMTLSGEGRYPVMHFGMTGMIQLRGSEPTWYRRKINLGETNDSWPPKFHKFIIKLTPPNGEGEPRELAFIDPRRLGRLRLVPDPVLSYPPLSELGFDPVLSHPTLDEFKELLAKKKGTIKGVIMDQAFSAGVGNWVADEVLYQARIHPLHPVPTLSDTQVADLHRLLREVPLAAIKVNADSAQFPPDWLFRFRWDKGKSKKAKKAQKKGANGVKAEMEAADEVDEGVDVEADGGQPKFLALPDGRPATITFVTVGGRTSAVVTELQKLPAANATSKSKSKSVTAKTETKTTTVEVGTKDAKKRGTKATQVIKTAKVTQTTQTAQTTTTTKVKTVAKAATAPKRTAKRKQSGADSDSSLSDPPPVQHSTRSQRAAARAASTTSVATGASPPKKRRR